MNATREQPRKQHRRHRSRSVPRWIKDREELDEMARRRCLLVLSVLSGEKPVTDAIAESKMSRNTYYQLEERALAGMLEALGPSPGPGRKADEGAKVAKLEERVGQLEREKRRAERLLLLTRKVMRKGRLTQPGLGRPRSTTGGGRSSSGTKAKPADGSHSTPRQAGAAEP